MDGIETLTGFGFLSTVDDDIKNALEQIVQTQLWHTRKPEINTVSTDIAAEMRRRGAIRRRRQSMAAKTHRASTVRKKPKRRLPPEALTDSEVRSLIDACPNSASGLRNRALIALLYGIGLRISEALDLYGSRGGRDWPAVMVIIIWLFLFFFRPHPHVPSPVNFNVNDVWRTAHGAVLDILLRRPRRGVDGRHDFFPAGIADVAGVVLHLYA